MPLPTLPRLRGIVRAGEELYPVVQTPPDKLHPSKSNKGNFQGRGNGGGRGKKGNGGGGSPSLAPYMATEVISFSNNIDVKRRVTTIGGVPLSEFQVLMIQLNTPSVTGSGSVAGLDLTLWKDGGTSEIVTGYQQVQQNATTEALVSAARHELGGTVDDSMTFIWNFNRSDAPTILETWNVNGGRYNTIQTTIEAHDGISLNGHSSGSIRLTSGSATITGIKFPEEQIDVQHITFDGVDAFDDFVSPIGTIAVGALLNVGRSGATTPENQIRLGKSGVESGASDYDNGSFAPNFNSGGLQSVMFSGENDAAGIYNFFKVFGMNTPEINPVHQYAPCSLATTAHNTAYRQSVMVANVPAEGVDTIRFGSLTATTHKNTSGDMYVVFYQWPLALSEVSLPESTEQQLLSGVAQNDCPLLWLQSDDINVAGTVAGEIGIQFDDGGVAPAAANYASDHHFNNARSTTAVANHVKVAGIGSTGTPLLWDQFILQLGNGPKPSLFGGWTINRAITNKGQVFSGTHNTVNSGVIDGLKVIRTAGNWASGKSVKINKFPSQAAVVAPYVDPFNDDVAFLVNFTGANGATEATDEGPNAAGITFSGNAVISTESRFNDNYNASLKLDGTSDHLIVNNIGSWWAPGSGGWTIEIRIRNTHAMGSLDVIRHMWSIATEGTNTPRYQELYMWPDGGTGNPAIEYHDSRASVFAQRIDLPGQATGFQTWTEWAVSFDGTKLYLYKNGTKVAEVTPATAAMDSNSAMDLRIGGRAGDTNEWLGYVQAFRMTLADRYAGANYTVNPAKWALAA